MPRIDLDSLRAARAELSRATSERTRSIAAFAKANAERTALVRRSGSNRGALESADRLHSDALCGLRDARAAELSARDRLSGLLENLPEPDEAIASIDGGYPIVLFPVRLETRFIRFSEARERDGLPAQTGELRVRIYPDAILADSHEPLLSAVELEAGCAYWRTAWINADQQEAWTALVATVGATRAAWIVPQCTPTNVAAFPRSPAAARAAPPPEFPPLETREPHWHRKPVARLLPDRWSVQAFKQHGVTAEEALRYRVTSRSIVEPLALTLAFTADGVTDDRIDVAQGLRLDREIRWTVDFETAERVGMAVRIPLVPEDFDEGFRRVVVVGVKTSLAPEETARQMRDLLDHHRLTRGLAYVPQGTPTNSTADAASGYPPPDPRATASFRTERGPALAQPGTDGARFMAALGLPPQAADHIAGADCDEQRGARAMATALWPVTMGYYLKQMLSSAPDVPLQPADLSDDTIEALRQHFIWLVRGRGPFPAFRVGDVPYGLLPVAVVDAPAEPASGLDVTLPSLLGSLQGTLADLARQYAPRVGRTSDPDGDLLETFRMDASAREVYVRPAVGEDTLDNVGGFSGVDERVHEPISLDAHIDLGGPGGPIENGPTLRSLLAFPADEPDQVVEHPPNGSGVPHG